MRRVFLVIAATFVMGTAALAHHSYGATYQMNKEVKIEGKIVQFSYRNPHSFVTVAALDDHRAMQRWAVVWSGTGQLGGQGVTRETLKPGDVVVISGSPGRNPADHRVRMVSLKRPSDGFSWGSRGETVD